MSESDSDYYNFSVFVEKKLQLEYQGGLISSGDEYWLRINCADNETLQVSNYSLGVEFLRFFTLRSI